MEIRLNINDCKKIADNVKKTYTELEQCLARKMLASDHENARLKVENAELKEFAEDACLERDDNQTAIDEFDDENRKLKRALWLARAWGANQRTKYLDLFLTGRAHAIRKYKWIKITSKCRAKAEEYK